MWRCWDIARDGKLWWTAIVIVVTVMDITCMNHVCLDMKECFRADMKSKDLLGSWTWLGILGFADGWNHVMWICDSLIMMRMLVSRTKNVPSICWDILLYFMSGFTISRIVLNTFATSIFHCYSFYSLRRGMCNKRELQTRRGIEWSHWCMGYS